MTTTESFNPTLPSECPWKLVRLDEGNGNFKYKLVPASEDKVNVPVSVPVPVSPTAQPTSPKSVTALPHMSLHSKMRMGAPTRSDVSRKTYTKTTYSPTRQGTPFPPKQNIGVPVKTPVAPVAPERGVDDGRRHAHPRLRPRPRGLGRGGGHHGPGGRGGRGGPGGHGGRRDREARSVGPGGGDGGGGGSRGGGRGVPGHV